MAIIHNRDTPTYPLRHSHFGSHNEIRGGCALNRFRISNEEAGTFSSPCWCALELLASGVTDLVRRDDFLD
ncbi:hypothetical protein EVAR_41525_1 [Eumeta japonica]|uniref:Uncharacterized protein n=1 Tax=Eumeta variegata TaxID=151549 RepID=A0A4C1X6J6_EUMVA|nr:hypothetical protein EVAR_41525_1 [Eumeta japonica]